MQPIRILSVAEQTAENLRTGLREGRWSGRLPGVVRLAAECHVSTRVVRAALRQLETEGLLAARGQGRSRTVAAPGGAEIPRRSLRVAAVAGRSDESRAVRTARLSTTGMSGATTTRTPDTRFPGTNANQPWENLCYAWRRCSRPQ